MLIILLHNDGTGNVKRGNYTYEVLLNETKLADGVVKGHNRKSGWQALVRKMVRVPKAPVAQLVEQ